MSESIIPQKRWFSADFTREELNRYSRHLIMPEVTAVGQKRLKAARVLCVGAGGLGSPAGLYLAAAGVGTIGLVDFDSVDVSNLQRQILHGTKDIGRRKVSSAHDRLTDINPNLVLHSHDCRLESENAIEIVGNYDLVLDGSDNFATRYLTNDVCVFLKKPNVYGSIFRFDGQTTVFAPHLGGPCYRCMFPEPPPPGSVPNCADAGVLGVLPGIIGVMQATEAIKLILGIGESLLGRLVHLDALQMRFREFKLRRDPDCPVCGENPTVREPIDYEQFCSGTAGRSEPTVPTITVHALNSKQQSGEPFLLVDVREPFESDLARIAGSKLMPLGQLPDRLNELNQQEVTVLYCKTGLRSERAVQFLQTAGFQNVYNLAGGIDAWIDEIDSSIPKY